MNKILYLLTISCVFLYSCKETKVIQPKETDEYIELLRTLAQDKSLAIQMNVAGNASTPADILETFATSNDPQLRASVAGNLATPVDMLTKLSEDETYEVKFALAYNPNTPKQVLLKLAKDTSKLNVANIIASESNLDLELYKVLYDLPGMKESLALNTNLSIVQIQQIYNDGVAYYSIAMNPITPVNILTDLSNMVDSVPELDGTYTVYHPYAICLVANPALPVQLIAQLSQFDNTVDDGTYSFDELVALNPNTPSDLFEKYARDQDNSAYFYVSSNPNASYEIIKLYLNSDGEWLRTNAASSISIPTDSLLVLAKNSDFAIRAGVALNKNTDEETLQLLADDKDETVRKNVALNPKTPIECLQKLAIDKNEEVRAAVADYQVLHITFNSDEIPYRSAN